MTALLHNMSVPPRSQVRVARQELAGVRVPVLVAPLLPAPVSRVEKLLACHGDGAALALLEAAPGCPWAQLQRQARLLAADPATPARLRRRLDQALAAAGLPDRVGVVLPAPASATRPASPLDLAASLAVLSRVSGALYLPRRAGEASLLRLSPVVVLFPEEA